LTRPPEEGKNHQQAGYCQQLDMPSESMFC
jgi:hypothetical protein